MMDDEYTLILRQAHYSFVLGRAVYVFEEALEHIEQLHLYGKTLSETPETLPNPTKYPRTVLTSPSQFI
jgi:hypothetical protein